MKIRMMLGIAAMFFGLTAMSAPSADESFRWWCNAGSCCTDVDDGYVCRECPDSLNGEVSAITIVMSDCGDPEHYPDET